MTTRAATTAAGTGSSTSDEAFEAGRASAADAIEALDGAEPGLLIVWTSVKYDQHQVVSGVRSVTGACPLIGATTAGHFIGSAVTPVGGGVQVLALSSAAYRFGLASEEISGPGDAREAGRSLARAARAAAGPSDHAALIVLTSGIEGQQQELLDGIYRAAGAAVPVVGGAAADDYTFDSSLVLHDDKVLASAAVAVWVASQHPLTVAAAHGWTSVGEPLLVTRVDGETLCDLDGRPAQGEYFGRLGYDASTRERVAAESDIQWSNPLGILQPDGSHVLRFVIAEADGRLTCPMPVAPFSAAQAMSAKPADLLAVVPSVAQAASAGREPSVILAFSCAARARILGEQVVDECVLLQEAAGDVPTFGFYTFGEYVRQVSVAGFHSGTLAALAL